MDHIFNYFNNTKNNLIKNISKKDVVIQTIKNITQIELETKEISFKKDILYIKIFGIKKTKILNNKDQILDFLKSSYSINFLDLK